MKFLLIHLDTKFSQFCLERDFFNLKYVYFYGKNIWYLSNILGIFCFYHKLNIVHTAVNNNAQKSYYSVETFEIMTTV